MLSPIGRHAAGRWLRRATEVTVPEGTWLALVVGAAGIAFCGAFVCACGSLVASRDAVDVQGIPAPTAFPGDTHGRIVRIVEGVFLPPLIVGTWALLLTAGALFLAPTLDFVATSLVSLAIATAVRTTAYYSEQFSETVARMLPFSLLGFVLLDGVTLRSVGTVAGVTDRFLANSWMAASVLLVLLVVETTLRTTRTVTRLSGR